MTDMTRPPAHFPKIAIFLPAAAALLSGSPACTPPAPPLRIEDPDPGVKIPAIRAEVAEEDHTVIADLIDELESDDPAIRFYASRALVELTGQTLGYRYYDSETERRAAVARWRQWLEQGQTDQKPGRAEQMVRADEKGRAVTRPASEASD